MPIGTALFLVGLLGAVATRPAGAEERPVRTVDVRIAMPQGGEVAGVVFGAGEVVLELPRGAEIPLDLGAIGNGLLLGTEVRPVEDGGVRLILRLGGAVVERVQLGGGILSIRLTQRTHSDVGNPQAEGSYRVGVDDLIQISVNSNPELTQKVVVGPSGTLVAPLIGEVEAVGLTTSELADRLTDRLARDYLVDPKVDVQVVEYRSQWVLVSGAVGAPGRVVLRGGANLKQVIAEAGGFTENAGPEIVISRTDPRTAEAERIVVDRDEFETGTVRLELRHADLITVPETQYCHILGDVRLPSRVRVDRGMTLFRALSSAGGLTEWANRKEIQILRSDGTVETYDLNEIQKGKTPDPPVRGGDRIYVKRRFL